MNKIDFRFALGILLLLGYTLTQSACKKEDDPVVLDPTVLDCDYFKQARVLTADDRPVHYRIDCQMEASADITIEAGVVIVFSDGAGIEVSENGSLSINGTATQNVKLTRLEGTAWKGLLYNSDDSKNKIEHCEISYAGSSSFNSNGDKAAVTVWADAKLTMNHVAIKNSSAYGLSAVYTNSNFTINNTQITDCANAPVVILPSYMGKMNTSNTHASNTNNYVEVQINTDEIKESMAWAMLDVPYRVTSNYNDFDFLKIAKGVVQVTEAIQIEFDAGTGLFIGSDGGLDLSSTTDKALFTGVTKQAGSWKTVYFQFTQAANRLDNLVIEYAGNTYDGSQQAIGLWDNPKLSLSNVEFKNIT
ncbi:MAG: hypothetical protein GY810_26445, partial [Aureispira sp.]|nr:hypothetical protein [Aureispira sp.]